MPRSGTGARCRVCGAPAGDSGQCERCAESLPRAGVAGPGRPSSDRPSGIVLEGKYRLLDEIGRGGMGTVFRALDQSLDRIVAVKFLLPELQEDQLLVESFRREARAVAAVRHDNVLQIYAFGRYGQTPFFVMEHIEGESAEDILVAAQRRGEQPSLAEVLRILEQTAGGLAAVHRGGVVHRDIKPGNLMVQQDTRRVVIMDFGLGHRYKPGDKRLSAEVVEPGGTPAYMAPELIAGKTPSGAAEFLTDIYAFGVTAFELVTGRLPFEADNWVEIFQQHLTEPPPNPSRLRPGLPAGLDDIILRCLAKAPAERCQSFDEVRDALEPLARAAAEPPPLGRADAAAADDAARPGKAGGRPRSSVERQPRVVVADPDPGFRAQVLQASEEELPGSRFRAARTTATALEIARGAPPLVLIAPADDATINGLELATTLAGDEALAAVRLVLTAERITAQERRIFQQLGVFHVLVKPVSEGELEAVLRRVAASVDDSGAARGA